MQGSRLFKYSRSRRGFSFAEVMFAVVILGIGLIMLAGIFPVALQQTQSSSDEAAAAAFARNATSVMQQVASYSNGFYVPPTSASANSVAQVYAFDDVTATPVHGSWPAVAGSIISPSDNRYAFVPLYLRPFGASYVQLYVICVQVQTRSIYDASGSATSDTSPAGPTTFLPKMLQANISGGSPYLITFANGSGASSVGGSSAYVYTANATKAVAPGCYVIVANDRLTIPNTPGALNGKIYRVGNQRLDLDPTGKVWEMMPGSDYVPQTGITAPPFATPLDVWIVGKQADLSSGNYAGKPQDISLYTTFVPVN